MRSFVHVLLGAAALSAAGCTLPDWMTSEARSPDGALTARAWCVDGCDVTQRRTITIGPSSIPAGERLRAADEAVRIYIAEHDDARLTLRWTGNRVLTIEGDCLSDDHDRPLAPRRFRDVTLVFVRAAGAFVCPTPRSG